ncbi:type II secretion system protein [Selenihalanaerobacter shriftii]|uniref:Prepilin-type N-terminal cleavage/methylation domain-containing protein n=1 Tax=Selenihalanaerobacter shriftii TaxID=142842 RepID=A0A1T4P4Q3_9FIRM|nr:type II secretion system protein [Selenihalanaerobacter shriftii]SJZ86236.1 prepilin-type N-terminal cleavage/methylation domain-containing protein [Selenihalanaerobacter shriftii]
MKLNYKGKEEGFTLLEIMVVLSLVGILSSLIIVRSGNLVSRYRLEATINEMTSDFRRVQQRAISEQVTYGIRFNPTNETYTLFNEDDGDIETKDLDDSLEYDDVVFGGDQEVTFKPIGTADNGHITVANDNNDGYTIWVSILGRIRLEKV